MKAALAPIIMHPIEHIPLLAVNATDLLPVAGLLLLTTGMMMMYRKRRKNQGRPTLTPHEQLERNHQLRGVRGDLETLMVEIEQLAKRLAAQLDAKSAALDLLLRQADARIAELKRLSQGNGHADEPRHSSPGQAHEPAQQAAPTRAPAEEPGDPLSQSVCRLADQGLDPPAIAAKLGEHVGKVELILALRSAR